MKPSKQATLQLVADHAGVSKATASMILSGQAKYLNLFTPETIGKVQSSADALGYRTNIFASNLSPERTPFFALITAGIEHENELTYDAFESLFIGGVLSVAADASTHPIVLTMSRDAPAARVNSIDSILFGGVFGTIARTPSAPIEERLRKQLQYDQPVVVVFPEDPAGWRSNVIEADNVAIGEIAGDLFASNGRTTWAVVCFTTAVASHEARIGGLELSTKTHRAKLEIIRLDTNPLSARGLSEVLVQRLARISPDAVFCVNTASTVGTMMAAGQLGIELGTKMDLIGVDYPYWAEEMMAKRGITSLSVSWKAAGKVAMQKLLHMRSSGKCRFPNTLLAPTIRIGRSCSVSPDLVTSKGVTVLPT